MNRTLECALHHIDRRQVTPPQRAMVGGRARDIYGRQAKERRLAMLKKGDKAPDVETFPPRENEKSRDVYGMAAEERQREAWKDHGRGKVQETFPEAIHRQARDVYDRQAKERQKLSKGRGQKGKEIFPGLNDHKQARDVYNRQAKERQKEQGGNTPGMKNTPGNISLSVNKQARDGDGDTAVVVRSIDDVRTVMEACCEI